MNLPHVHLLLNHLPILATYITLALFVASLIGKLDDLKQASLVLFVLIALISIPTYMSGSGAQQMLKESPDVSMAAVELHQGSALIALIFMEITGALSLIALWPFSRTSKNPWQSRPAQFSLAAVLVVAFITSGLMAVAGNTGGNIRHPEILAGQESKSVIGAWGEGLVASVHHFVIDWTMWMWPVLEDLHFMGLILLVGSILVVNLRILGVFKKLPLAPLHRFIPWGIAGFVTNIVTGLFFYLGMPDFYNLNFVFQIKMFTVMIAGGILLLFYCTSAFRKLEHLGSGEDAPMVAKVLALSSIVLWLAIVVLGRYIPWGEVPT
jgi:hypothetical protein